MLKRWMTGSVVFALVILMVVPAASAGKGGSDRPFQAWFTGEVHWEFTEHCAEPPVTTLVTGAVGNATHMGRVTTDWAHCPANDAADDGTITIVAANGDELWGMYDYPGIDEGEPITFVGGTGRFADASGAAYVTYDVELTFRDGCDPESDPLMCLTYSPWSAHLTGTINY